MGFVVFYCQSRSIIMTSFRRREEILFSSGVSSIFHAVILSVWSTSGPNKWKQNNLLGSLTTLPRMHRASRNELAVCCGRVGQLLLNDGVREAPSRGLTACCDRHDSGPLHQLLFTVFSAARTHLEHVSRQKEWLSEESKRSRLIKEEVLLAS